MLRFLQQVFGRPEYDEVWFSHVRHGSPVGPRAYYLARAEETGELVGLYGLAPVRLRLGPDVGEASECCNTGVHPLFWGTGLFQDLSRYALAADARKGRWLAFCSPRRPMAVRAHQAVGWETLASLRFYVRPAPAQAGMRAATAVAAFPPEVDALLAASGEGAGWRVVKDHTYLNWRYGRPPYQRFVYRDAGGRPTGLLVTKDYAEPDGSRTRTHIMELEAAGDQARGALYAQAAGVAAGRDELHTWAVPGGAAARRLEAAGFEAQDGGCPLLVYAYTPEARAQLETVQRYDIALGDDEAF